MRIEVIETNDTVRRTLFGNVLEALKACGINGKVVIINDIRTMLKYGVNSAPALIINGIVMFAGKSQSPEEIMKLLQQNLHNFS
jgi:protein-disulfide isomerase